MEMKKYDAEMVLNMDITRRCNMKCDFCLKGDAENQTITKEIVDKTLDEIQNFALASIRLYGGEPFLCPDMIEYVFDQIIERKITLGHVKINTNGTVMNSQILKALERIARYIDDNRSSLRKVFPMFDYSREPTVEILVSTIRHDNSDEEVDRCVAYYSKIKVSGFECRRDREDKNQETAYVLTGDMLKNHRQILSNPLNLYSLHIPGQRYDFMTQFNYSNYSRCDLPYDILIRKTISVSTNGDVYIRCSVPWSEISDKKIFNILDCNGDFLHRLDEYCWKYPVNKKIAELRERCAILSWCVSNGYIVENADKDTIRTIVERVELSGLHEAGANALHKEFPFLNHEEVDRITSAQMVIEFLTQGENLERIRGYMRSCTNLTEEMIQKCDIGEMINLRDTIIKEAEEREGLREKSSKTSVVSQTTPEKLGSALGLLLGLALFAGKKK